MDTQALRVSERKISTGRVYERAFRTIRNNPGVTLGLALIFGAIPGVLMTYSLTIARQDLVAGGTTGSFASGFLALTLISTILGFAISAFVQGMLTRATVAESEGRKAGFGECARAALSVALPLIGLSILLALGVAIGFMLLVVPGMMLYCAWSVAAPALVEERAGVFESFRRSRELTRGVRWKIFVILLVLGAVYYLLSLAAAAVGFASMDDLAPEAIPANLSTGLLLTSLVMGLLFNVIWGTVQASLYVELRDFMEGPAAENLEEVFA